MQPVYSSVTSVTLSMSMQVNYHLSLQAGGCVSSKETPSGQQSTVTHVPITSQLQTVLHVATASITERISSSEGGCESDYHSGRGDSTEGVFPYIFIKR